MHRVTIIGKVWQLDGFLSLGLRVDAGSGLKFLPIKLIKVE